MDNVDENCWYPCQSSCKIHEFSFHHQLWWQASDFKILFTIASLSFSFVSSAQIDAYWHRQQQQHWVGTRGSCSESLEVCHKPSPPHIDSVKIKPLHDASHRRAGAADLLSVSDLTSLADLLWPTPCLWGKTVVVATCFCHNQITQMDD